MAIEWSGIAKQRASEVLAQLHGGQGEAKLLMDELTGAGLAVQLEGRASLKISPPDKLTDAFRERIRRHKPALLEILSAKPAIVAEPVIDEPTPLASGITEEDLKIARAVLSTLHEDGVSWVLDGLDKGFRHVQ